MTDPTDAALTQLAGLVLEDGRRWGEAAVPVQLADARAVLNPDSAAAPNHLWTRPRGFSKTTDLAGASIAALLTQLGPGARAYGAASDRDQARLLIDAIAGFVARTPGLGGALTVDSYKVTATRTGAVFEVLAADASGSWGLRPSWVVVDELAQWRSNRGPLEMWRALVSSLGKVPGARLVALTSAGDPSHWSFKVLEHARSSPEWRTSEVAGPVPWVSSRWLGEQRRMLPTWEYARLHLNEWTGADDRLTTLDDLRACVTLDGPLRPDPRHKYVVSLDVGLKRDRTVAVVAHAEDLGQGEASSEAWGQQCERVGGQVIPVGTWGRPRSLGAPQRDSEPAVARPVRIVLDRISTWQGSRLSPVRLETVESWLLQASQSFGRAPLILDPWQAVGLAQRLRERGVEVSEFAFSSASVGRLATTLHTLLRDHALALPDDPELLEELANVRLRESAPGVVRMDHDAGRHDDRAIALALAAQELLSRPRRRPVSVVSYRNVALRGTR